MSSTTLSVAFGSILHHCQAQMSIKNSFGLTFTIDFMIQALTSSQCPFFFSISLCFACVALGFHLIVLYLFHVSFAFCCVHLYIIYATYIHIFLSWTNRCFSMLNRRFWVAR